MRQIVLLLVVLAASFFLYRYQLSRRERRMAGVWGGRVLLSLAFAAAVLLALFVLSVSTNWRFF